MKRVLILFISLSVFCNAKAQDELGPLDKIIPQPKEYTLGKGRFKVTGASFKCEDTMDKTAVAAVKRFAARLSLVSGKTSNVSTPIGLKASVENGSAKGLVFLTDNSLAAEEYSMEINSSIAVVRASSLNGFLYSLQTLMQLLPETLYGTTPDPKAKWFFPCCTIKDSPSSDHRGMLLDSSRHFMEIKDMKRYIDLMAFFKLNRLHWRLAGDKIWRIEIKSIPLLTQILCWEEGDDGVRHGGFYTQEQVREIVKYAADKAITIVPEIDFSGHMQETLSANPETAYNGNPDDFLDIVRGEMAGLFPYMGGDESPENVSYLDLSEATLFPRLLESSEAQWCSPEQRDMDKFKKALEQHGSAILKNAGYNYSK